MKNATPAATKATLLPRQGDQLTLLFPLVSNINHLDTILNTPCNAFGEESPFVSQKLSPISKYESVTLPFLDLTNTSIELPTRSQQTQLACKGYSQLTGNIRQRCAHIHTDTLKQPLPYRIQGSELIYLYSCPTLHTVNFLSARELNILRTRSEEKKISNTQQFSKTL